jgi:hypothetical protein
MATSVLGLVWGKKIFKILIMKENAATVSIGGQTLDLSR